MPHSSKYEKVGSIWVDTATLLIADPCQVIPDGRDGDKRPRWEYRRAMDLFQEQVADILPAVVVEGIEIVPAMKGMGWAPHVRMPNDTGGTGGVMINTGTDGWFPVFIQRDKDGEPRRIVIEMGGQIKP